MRLSFVHSPGIPPNFVSVHKSRFVVFVKGLRSELQISVLQVAATAKSFQEVVDFVVEVEGVKPDEFTWHRHQRGFEREVSLMVLTLEDRVPEVTQFDPFSLHYRL